MNIVGTPWNAVICSLLMQARAGLGEKYGRGRRVAAVGHCRRHCKHHSEAVEHRHLNHHTVGGGKIHSVAYAFAVVDNVIMGEHNALGETGRAGGVLHIAYIVLVHTGSHTVDLLHGHLGGAVDRLVPGKTPFLAVTHRYDVSQEGQAFAVELAAVFGVFKLGAKLGHNLTVIGVL